LGGCFVFFGGGFVGGGGGGGGGGGPASLGGLPYLPFTTYSRRHPFHVFEPLSSPLEAFEKL